MRNWLKKLKNAVKTAVSVLVLWDKGFKVWPRVFSWLRVGIKFNNAWDAVSMFIEWLFSWWN